MTSQSSIISFIYKSRQNIINLMKRQNYNVKDYDDFSINEVNSMKQNNQLDMLLETKNISSSEKSSIKKKIYIRYYLAKTIRPINLEEMIDDLFNTEEILTKDDTLFIIIKDEINETLTNKLIHLWEKDGIFIIIESIKRLQFNILEHDLVPIHIIMNEPDVIEIMQKYNITKNQFPDISRFDPVAQVIGLRPGKVCQIIRPSKTSVTANYYRVCV